ncbi:type II toxin-antitoxin system RnlA family toxin [Candidatus Microgenomates bacterium]|nr:type II toxin-antitoxin system RnlA family toxin [Candidatus Microgenomates bacterium]
MPKKVTIKEEGMLRFRFAYRANLRNHFKSEKVFKFIPRKIKELIIDWLIIMDFAKERKFEGGIDLKDDIFGDWNEPFKVKISELLIDYSFLITPIFKAYEGFLHHLLNHFEIPFKKSKKTGVGYFYSLENRYHQKKEILDLIKKKMPDKEGLERWKELYGILRRYRHNPAHYGGWVDTIEQAENYGKTLISAIDGVIAYILDDRE